jgi:DNA-binding CsgD family transcriptional regulator
MPREKSVVSWLKDRAARLTPRELDVFVRMAVGPSNSNLARSLVVSENTIRVHLQNIRSKFGGASRDEVIVWAVLWNELDCRERLLSEPRDGATILPSASYSIEIGAAHGIPSKAYTTVSAEFTHTCCHDARARHSS